MAEIVYGNATIEPGGMELDDESYQDECPECGSETAIWRHWQSAAGGSINPYYSCKCKACGHYETDWANPWEM
ncbi:MAG: hypothetical protein ACRC67_17545 [Inquilinus sp.]|uniref:hypothetical protein n=1 Tax=Inquilinus sp. TaxID=1932117 RepID=UPI003F373581